MINVVVTGLNGLAAILAFAAAYFWFGSAGAEVKDRTKAPGTSTMSAGEIYYGQVAVGATSRLQSKFNRRGALCAGLSAMLQAIVLLAGLAQTR